jgi:5-methylcytosine-specific restriction endonuclease McrA
MIAYTAQSWEVFMKRTANIYAGHKRRARAAGHKLDYTMQELRAWVHENLGTPCSYCPVRLTVHNITVDHRVPTCRGGFHRADNLDFVCKRCNEIKGSLLDSEMFELLALVGRWGPVTRTDFLARLRAGGKLVKQRAVRGSGSNPGAGL